MEIGNANSNVVSSIDPTASVTPCYIPMRYVYRTSTHNCAVYEAANAFENSIAKGSWHAHICIGGCSCLRFMQSFLIVSGFPSFFQWLYLKFEWLRPRINKDLHWGLSFWFRSTPSILLAVKRNKITWLRARVVKLKTSYLLSWVLGWVTITTMAAPRNAMDGREGDSIHAGNHSTKYFKPK